jgi:hypothetical protein
MAQEGAVQLELTLSLPDEVMREAEARGLLNAQSLESLIKAELQRRRVEHLFSAADRLAALPAEALTEVEVEREIRAARAERRSPHASSS